MSGQLLVNYEFRIWSVPSVLNTMWTDNTAKVNSKTEVNTLSSLSSLFLTELKNNNDLLPISFYIYLYQ